MHYKKYPNLKMFLFTYKVVVLFTRKLKRAEQLRKK